MAAGLVARRLLQAAAALLAVLLVVFVCLLTTGDPVEMLAPPEASERDKAMIRQAYGLDRPLLVQFGLFVWRAARGDFGRSFFSDRPALGLVSERLPASLELALASTVIAVAVGVPLGMLVGYWGGWLESLVMRATDMLLIFPIIMLSIVIVVIAGPSEHGIVVALGLSQAPTFVRIARGVTLAVRQELYVEAAVAAGAGRISILVHHVWPNIAAPIIVQATLTLPVFVLNASALSYLGLGVQPPTPEWGQMLNEAKEFLITAPHLLIGPATALILFVLSANLVGDAVQETLDPRLNRRR